MNKFGVITFWRFARGIHRSAAYLQGGAVKYICDNHNPPIVQPTQLATRRARAALASLRRIKSNNNSWPASTASEHGQQEIAHPDPVSYHFPELTIIF